ncbi:flagellin [Kiloniella sp. b19]|uniref:flagellin n=1 Tax=Kiloniella sp. GXU_MW_B19 TaxID=3141326 RepID=UPI0031D3F37B
MPVINTNVAANSAIRFLNNNSADAASSVAKLSSGSRIVRASDDAAGLAVSTQLTGDINVLKQAGTNASQAASILQIADGGLARISDTLQRLKVLAAQSLSGAVTDTERGFINAEYSALNTEVGEIVTRTTFNGQQLINTDLGNFFVGVASADVIQADLSTGNASITTGVGSPGGGVATTGAATTALTNVDNQLGYVSTQRAVVGALISRFETRGQNIATTIENTQAANSTIADVDVAQEQTELVASNVRIQAAVSALSQANQLPQQLLRVLQ